MRTSFLIGAGRAAAAALLVLSSACTSMEKAGGPVDLAQALQQRGYRLGETLRSLPSFSLSGWSYIDEHHIQIDDGPGRDYLVKFTSPCPELAWADRIGYTTTAGTFSRMERILARDMGRPVSCLVEALYRLERVAKAPAQ